MPVDEDYLDEDDGLVEDTPVAPRRVPGLSDRGSTLTPLQRALEADRLRAEQYEEEQRQWAKEGRDHQSEFRAIMRRTGRVDPNS